MSCGDKSCGDWRSGKEHAAHLGHMCPRYVIGILMVVAAFPPWALAAVHLPVGRVVIVVSLLAFVISFV
jgi:hypothetical protein